MALSTGTILAGRYEITEPIATGGMGEVWRARDRVLDRVVAAKVLRSEYTGDPSFVARFRNEARHTAALSHPNIASVYDYGETEAGGPGQTLAFLVMELVEGKPLVTILHEEGRLPVDWTLHVLEQAADGLSAAHAAGVVHRDIKPGNLIVRPDGVVKLTDFGIARTRDATPLTRTGMVVGTAQYLSPEQAQGMETTAASDVYSLGVVGYECLTGVRPFDGTSQVAIALAHINRPPPPLPGDIPPAVRLLVERALAKDPHDRFADGADFAAAIRSVAAGNGLASPATSGTGMMAAARTEVIPEVDGDGTRVLGGPVTGVAAGAAAAGAAAAAGPRTGGRHAAGARTMPPLQGPPVDGDDRTGWGGQPPARRRGPDRRLLWALLSLLLVAGVVAGAYFLLAGNDDDPGGTTAGTTSSSATASGSATATQQFVNIPAASQYVGEDAEDVRAELEEAGLEVTLADADAGQLAAAGVDLDAGEVAAVDPAGLPVPRGSGVTLYVAQEDYTVPETEEDPGNDGGGGQGDGDTGGGSGNGGGGGTTQTQTSTPPPTSTATESPEPTTVSPTTTSPSPTTQSGQPAPPPPTTASPPTVEEPPVDEGTEPEAGNGPHPAPGTRARRTGRRDTAPPRRPGTGSVSR
ncbi:serine/threonine-protein kinase [Geodermatophilus normandii]|uniref:non-specific serine/threonine protein kinase n=1 Tax=Geodermatophilus normandii TaxID=1137989 RepID=A0A317QKJ5_9ACTN|nr:protein kinase [Geodermatophilus normandii]PWW22160.1 serine/threonine-protein kinase [Geodermatophilus normandii]